MPCEGAPTMKGCSTLARSLSWSCVRRRVPAGSAGPLAAERASEEGAAARRGAHPGGGAALLLPAAALLRARARGGGARGGVQGADPARLEPRGLSAGGRPCVRRGMRGLNSLSRCPPGAVEPPPASYRAGLARPGARGRGPPAVSLACVIRAAREGDRNGARGTASLCAARRGGGESTARECAECGGQAAARHRT
jgi:hypothetical protein